jgi:shikimate kinase
MPRHHALKKPDPAADSAGRAMEDIITSRKSNIVLIGMPGAGKSTAGIVLAKLISRNFLDTDVLIQARQGRSLQSIVDTEGHLALRDIEEQVLLSLHCCDHVIATGGSAVYSKAAMRHLATDGTIVFLDADIQVLESRIRNFATRGLAKKPGQTFKGLFQERRPLYQRYADITIECSGLAQEDVCAMIIEKLGI